MKMRISEISEAVSGKIINEYEDYDSDLIQDDLHQLDVINGREEPTEDEVADGLVRVRLDCGDRSDSDRNEDDINKFEERIKNTIDLIISYRKSMEYCSIYDRTRC